MRWLGLLIASIVIAISGAAWAQSSTDSQDAENGAPTNSATNSQATNNQVPSNQAGANQPTTGQAGGRTAFTDDAPVPTQTVQPATAAPVYVPPKPVYVVPVTPPRPIIVPVYRYHFWHHH
jgi:hypothetical protein